MIKQIIKTVHAADGIITNPALKNPTTVANSTAYVNSVIQTIVSIFLFVGVLYFLWHFIMSAYHMISSQGDPDKWKKAQQGILHAATGIIIVFAIFAVLKFVGGIFGISDLKNLTLSWPTL